MSIWAIFGFLADLVKLGKMADYFWSKHQARVYAQNDANEPKTKSELLDRLRSGK